MRLSLAALLLCLVLPPRSWAQARPDGLQRCVNAQGNSVFTDRSCQSLDAQPRAASSQAPGQLIMTGPIGCARRRQDLVIGVRAAIDARDVNYLAAFYHWPGLSPAGARGALDQLEAIAARPLLAIAVIAGDSDTEQRRPRALQLEQALADGGIGTLRVRFELHRHAGCWWLRL